MQPERLQLAMQRRALHPDERGRARDISAKACDLGQKILALEHFPGIAQRQLHDLATLFPAQHRRGVFADVVGQDIGPDRPAIRRRQDEKPFDDVAQLAAISFKTRVPPCAISKAPETWSESASPSLLSVPNSSISRRSAGMVEQLTTTKGPPARFDP